MQADYTKLTVPKLKALLDERGTGYPKDARKAELVELLEQEDTFVEAEVIEDERVELVPATIDAAMYLQSKRDWLDRMLEPYRDMDEKAIQNLDVDEAKACRADVNRIIKEIEDERKAIKRRYNEPLERFEAEVKAILEPARESADMLKAYLDEQEAARKELRRQGLEATYIDFCAANGLESLPGLVPFQRLLDEHPKWLNKTTNSVKAAEEVEDIVTRLGKDWGTLQTQRASLPFYEEAEAEFFRTLDVSAALAYSARRQEEQGRIEAVKADRDSAASYKAPEFVEVEPDDDWCTVRRPYVLRAYLSDDEKARLIGFMQKENIGTDRTIGIDTERGAA